MVKLSASKHIQYGPSVADSILKCIFMNENCYTMTHISRISLQCVTQGTFTSKSVLIGVMNSRLASDHPLHEQTLIKMLGGNWVFMLRIDSRIASFI